MKKAKTPKMENKYKAKKGTFFRLLKFVLANYKWQCIVVLLCIIVSSFSSVLATVFLQRIIDDCITPGIVSGISAVYKTLITYVIFMALIYLSGIICSFIYTRIMVVVTQGSVYRLRKEMFTKMQKLPIKYFDTHEHGSIMSNYTNDSDAIWQFIGESLPSLIQSAISFLSLFAMMFYFSVYLTLVVILSIFIILFVVKKIGGKSAKYMVKQQQSMASEEGFIEEMMVGQKVIKVFCHEDNTKEKFVKFNEQLYLDGKTAHSYGNILMPALNNIGNIFYVLLALLGALMVGFGVQNVGLSGIGVITIGIIVSFLSMSRQVSQTINQASMQVSMIAMAMAGASRMFDLIDEEEEKDDGYVSLVYAKKDKKGRLVESVEYTGIWAWKHPHKAENSVSFTELKGEIQFVDVDFEYESGKPVLHNFTMDAKAGQKIALVGSTGAGKTTITNLLNRFYDIQSGKIRYDGINIKKINKSDLRLSIGMVLQDVNLFSGSVIDNIRYGKLDASDEECKDAAKLANADDFICRLPEGYNTILSNNGANLSQGQRQLLSIARAAVSNAPVMILDEATSSIDTRTEKLVQDGMDKLMQNRTVFVIAHRLSTIVSSDQILVLDHGRVIEKGTHKELIEKQGSYYQLYTGAFELE